MWNLKTISFSFFSSFSPPPSSRSSPLAVSLFSPPRGHAHRPYLRRSTPASPPLCPSRASLPSRPSRRLQRPSGALPPLCRPRPTASSSSSSLCRTSCHSWPSTALYVPVHHARARTQARHGHSGCASQAQLQCWLCCAWARSTLSCFRPAQLVRPIWPSLECTFFSGPMFFSFPPLLTKLSPRLPLLPILRTQHISLRLHHTAHHPHRRPRTLPCWPLTITHHGALPRRCHNEASQRRRTRPVTRHIVALVARKRGDHGGGGRKAVQAQV